MAKILLIEDNELNCDNALAASCDAYNAKLVELSRLLAKIEALLTRAGRGATA